MTISHKKRQQLSRLVTEGENLDPVDLEAFYRWVHTSYEALGFRPSQQRRFDEYCRSSSDTYAMRIYVGVWILRLSLVDISTVSRDSENK